MTRKKRKARQPQAPKKKDPLRCDLCLKAFGTKTALQDHMRSTKHSICVECNITFDKEGEHLQHVRSVNHATEFGCEKCGRKYPTRGIVDTHCCVCDRIFDREMDLSQHLNSRHKQEEPVALPPRDDAKDRVFTCTFCPNNFPTASLLYTHISQRHPAVPCPCHGVCGETFIHPRDFINHFRKRRCESDLHLFQAQKLAVDNAFEIRGMDPGDWAYSLFPHIPKPEPELTSTSIFNSPKIKQEPESHSNAGSSDDDNQDEDNQDELSHGDGIAEGTECGATIDGERVLDEIEEEGYFEAYRPFYTIYEFWEDRDELI